jgi:hypothetical protein
MIVYLIKNQREQTEEMRVYWVVFFQKCSQIASGDISSLGYRQKP